MYAIVDIAGHQYKVKEGQEIFVNRLEAKEGSKMNFDQVLLVDNDGKVDVGTPVVKGVKVSAEVLEHLKGDKVTVFKKKRRKGYQKENGHRDYLTKIKIAGIGKGGAKKKATEEVKEEKEETE
ncbi:MAG: 50S ribosomal protein L21 [Bacteroidales bacterium]|nr:50S ribosomal protein L21 [Bacteroidales bacterium]